MKDYLFDSKEYTLDNGLHIVSIKKDTQISCVHLGIKIGAMYESADEKGISHFLEHMMFKGTKKRNNEDINEDLEMLGGEYNAYTDYGCTVYSVTCVQDELVNGMEIIGDMVMNSYFPQDEMEKERGVILSEIRSSMDDVEDMSFKLVSEKAYKYGPLKYDISGTEENVRSFTKKDITDFYNKYYTPGNAYLAVVSSMEHEDIKKEIIKIFEKWHGRKEKLPDVVMEDNHPGIFSSYKNNIEQSTIVYLFNLNHIEKKDELPLKILSHRLGESSNSLLFRELREKRGLAYDVYTHLDLSENIKTLSIYTAVEKENAIKAMEVIDSAIKDIKERRIKFDARTMKLMKKIYRTAVLSTLEDSTDLCNYVVHQCLSGSSIHEFINDMRILQDVDREGIYRCAEEFLVSPTIHILKNKK